MTNLQIGDRIAYRMSTEAPRSLRLGVVENMTSKEVTVRLEGLRPGCEILEIIEAPLLVYYETSENCKMCGCNKEVILTVPYCRNCAPDEPASGVMELPDAPLNDVLVDGRVIPQRPGVADLDELRRADATQRKD